METNGAALSEAELDELERITAEIRCLERRCRNRAFGEVGYMLGLAEESAKQTLRKHAHTARQTTPTDVEEDDYDSQCVIPFRAGA